MTPMLPYEDDARDLRHGMQRNKNRLRGDRKLARKSFTGQGIPGTDPTSLPWCPSGMRVSFSQYPYGSCKVY